MRNAILFAAVAALAGASLAGAATPPLMKEEVDKVLAALLPPCPDPTTVRADSLPIDLGNDLRATMVRVDSANPWCASQMLALAGPGNSYYLGTPWLLTGLTGTPAEKIRQFAWNRMQLTVEPKLAMAPRKDGFIAATLEEKTEYGKIKLSGIVDRQGTIFIPGDFRPLDGSARRNTLAALAPIVAKAPSRGGTKAAVTVYEFSDFQCPACKRTAGLSDKVAAEFGDRVHYVRVDLPLMSSHPWAFPAALMGRAIWNQSPAAFWEYKKAVYANQERLNVFTLEDFARNFVSDHDLDLARFEKDIASQALKEEILASVGAARSLQINGTPTFLVNGAPVIAGEGGEGLLAAIRKEIGR